MRKLPSHDRYIGDVTTAAGRPPIGSPNLGEWFEKRAYYLIGLCPTNQTKYFIDPVNGSTLNDGRDGIRKTSGAAHTWTESTKTLTRTNNFTNYTWQPGDQIYVSGGTAVTAGLYDIASKTDNSNIVLSSTIVTNGSNPTDVTVSSGPKQTGSDANTLLAAGACRVLFKRGTVMNFATGLTAGADNVSIGTYGTGPRAVVNTNPTVYQASDWTQATLNVRYTRARPFAVAAVREQGQKNRVYVRCSTTAQVEATPGSYYDDGVTLHVHSYFNVDMDAVGDNLKIEVFPVNSANGLLVNGSNTFMLVEGVEFHGFGAQTTLNSASGYYGIHSELSGSNALCLKDCGAFINEKHNIGGTSGVGSTGGTLVCVGCEAGFTTSPDTPYVSYASSGDSEMYLIDCEATASTILPINAGGTPDATHGGYDTTGTSEVSMWTAHGNTINDAPKLIGNVRGRVKRGPMQCGGFGDVTMTGTTTDANAIRGYNIDCYYEARCKSSRDCTYLPSGGSVIGTVPYQITGGNSTDGFTCAYINCYIEARPQNVGASVDNFGALDTVSGFHVNTTFDVSYEDVDVAVRTGTVTVGLVQSADNLKCNLHNCHINLRPGTAVYQGITSYGAYNASSASTRTPTKFKMYDCIVTVNPQLSTLCYFGAGNNLDGSAVAWNPSRIINLVTNIPYNNGAGDSPDSRRYSGATGTLKTPSMWEVGKVPAVGEIDATPNTMLGGWPVLHDRWWNLRRLGTSAMGPVEAK